MQSDFICTIFTSILVSMLNVHRLESVFCSFIYLPYLFTDLDPCLNVECPSFGVCKTYSAHESRCVCFQDCPSYQDPVCTANGTTYDNKCWHELSYCRGLENNLVYHPGSCEGKHSSQTLFLCAVSAFCPENA